MTPAAITPHHPAGSASDHRLNKANEAAVQSNKDSDSETESTCIEGSNKEYRGEGVTDLIETYPTAAGGTWGCHQCGRWNDSATAPEFCAQCYHHRFCKCKIPAKLAGGVDEEM